MQFLGDFKVKKTRTHNGFYYFDQNNLHLFFDFPPKTNIFHIRTKRELSTAESFLLKGGGGGEGVQTVRPGKYERSTKGKERVLRWVVSLFL